ncbi:hypothetical protein CYLTODRAFT_202455 [Cylindrobasidium torrendii FP15055 ss-10]|uniref:BTB domain-containing protein n=1 Tax=Cylindrobasidium torrendii FP15055 ss-10 TaxID=1314674 RepID=A0A0D7BIQ5_9AGAR|nr:hypothetical protein CYLTODRAFT_202455 [Cylindrobasidium torrendii FP15055 ss-10]
MSFYNTANFNDWQSVASITPLSSNDDLQNLGSLGNWDGALDLATGQLLQSDATTSASSPPRFQTNASDKAASLQQYRAEQAKHHINHFSGKISVSTTFHPNAQLGQPGQLPDIILQSVDGVLFHVHYDVLNQISDNGFGNFLQEPSPIAFNQSSQGLNIILHAIYDIPAAKFHHPINLLIDTVDSLTSYGVHPSRLVHRNSSLFQLLYLHAPQHPMELYMLAGAHRLEELAIMVSAHLLSFPLDRLSDEMVDRMGALFLKRLVFLHLDRIKALKAILSQPPPPHGCGDDPQRAWALAAASVANDAMAGMSPQMLVSSMKRSAGDMRCTHCQENTQRSLGIAAMKWANVKATI